MKFMIKISKNKDQNKERYSNAPDDMLLVLFNSALRNQGSKEKAGNVDRDMLRALDKFNCEADISDLSRLLKAEKE